MLHQAARFLFVVAGKGIININGFCLEMKPGALVSMMPWDFSEVTKVDEPLQYFIFKYNIDLVNSFIKYFQDEENSVLSIMQENHITFCQKEEQELIYSIFRSLMEEIGEESKFTEEQKVPLKDVYIISKSIELITFFVRKIKNQELQSKIGKQETDKDLMNVFKYLYSHLSENPTSTSTARIFFTNRSALCKYIKSTTGYSFEDLINEMKINKTTEMLLYTQIPIGEIAKILGFVDQSHLSNFFKKRMNRSPGNFRKTFKPEIVLMDKNEARLFYRVLDYVCKNYAEDLSIDSVADKFAITSSKLNEMFLYHVEKTFPNFLNFIRINHASVMLLKSNKSITDIAFDVGYNNTKTFLRNFNKFRHMSPTEFKIKGALQEFDL